MPVIEVVTSAAAAAAAVAASEGAAVAASISSAGSAVYGWVSGAAALTGWGLAATGSATGGAFASAMAGVGAGIATGLGVVATGAMVVLGVMAVIAILAATMGLVVAGHFAFNLAQDEFKEFIGTQDDWIQNAGIPGGGGTKHEHEIGYQILDGESKHAKVFKKQKHKELVFRQWNIGNGDAIACWKKHKSNCLYFKNMFLGCAWSGHNIPAGPVTMEIKGVEGSVEAYWFMPNFKHGSCWPGFPNGEPGWSELPGVNATSENRPGGEWPNKEYFPASEKIKIVHKAGPGRRDEGSAESAISDLHARGIVPRDWALEPASSAAATDTNNSNCLLDHCFTAPPGANLPPNTAADKPHSTLVNAILSTLLASHPTADLSNPLLSTHLTPAISSISNLTTALLQHPDHGILHAHETLQHAITALITDDRISEHADIVEEILLSTSRSFAADDGSEGNLESHAHSVGVEAGFGITWDRLLAGSVRDGDVRVFERMFGHVKRKEESSREDRERRRR